MGGDGLSTIERRSSPESRLTERHQKEGELTVDFSVKIEKQPLANAVFLLPCDPPANSKKHLPT